MTDRQLACAGRTDAADHGSHIAAYGHAALHGSFVTGQALHTHIVGIVGIHLQHDGLSGGQIDLTLGSVSFKGAHIVHSHAGVIGVFTDPVHKHRTAALIPIGREAAAIQKDIANRGVYRVELLAEGLFHHIVGSCLIHAHGGIDPDAVHIVLTAVSRLCVEALCRIGASGYDLHLIGAVLQAVEADGGNMIIACCAVGHSQIIHHQSLLIDSGAISNPIKGSNSDAGVDAGVGVHIYTGAGEGEGDHGATLTVDAGAMGAAIGPGSVIGHGIDPAVDITIVRMLLMLRHLCINIGATGGDDLPAAGEIEALNAVGAVGYEGILVIHGICGDHIDLTPQIAVAVGILGGSRRAGSGAEYIELVITAPAHGLGLIDQHTIFINGSIAVGRCCAVCGGVAACGGGGLLGVKLIHAIGNIAIHMNSLAAGAAVIEPAGQLKALGIIQHIAALNEDGCGLIEGKELLLLPIFHHPNAGFGLVGDGGTAPGHILSGFHAGDLHHHTLAVMALLDVIIGIVIAGDIHLMRGIAHRIGIGGIGCAVIGNRNFQIAGSGALHTICHRKSQL